MSATHLPSEEFAVTVHRRAEVLDVTAARHALLRQTVLDIYVPRYGDDWGEFLDAKVLLRIEAERMFTFHLR